VSEVGRRLIAAKIRPPALPGVVISRARLEAALLAAAEGRHIVLIVAGAGAGKTTAAVQFFAARDRPAAWLSVDRADRVAGRFVTYLSGALGALEPHLGVMVRDLLADGLPPEDCAALLAEQVGAGWTVVLDDLHHLEPDAPALGALRAFLRSLPPTALAVLVSRRLPSVDLPQEVLSGRVEGLFDDELAFRLEETGALLAAREMSADPASVQEATGGWAAGIVFEALRGPGARRVLPPGEDPLFAYLAEQVLDALHPPLREAVLRSAVLDLVTPDHLARLLRDPAAAAHYAEIARQHLPAVLEANGLRYHPQFREFLQHRLREEAPGELSDLLAAHAEIMASEGYIEEAVDVLLQADRRDEAEALAEQAVAGLRRRGDWGKILSWLAALGEDAPRRRPPLREAQVRALLNDRRQAEVEELVHGMLASGEVAELGEVRPDIAAWAVWTLHGSGEWAKLLPLLPPRGRSVVAEVMRYLLIAAVAREPPEELAAAALGRMHPLHVVLETALYYQGRFDAAERLATVAAAGGGPVTAAVAQIHKVNVLRARGELAAARRVLEAAPASIRTSRFIEFWLHAEAELALEEGQGERALELIRRAREVSRRHGWRVGDGAIFGAVEGRMLVRLGQPETAIPVLEGVREWCARRGLAAFREWAEAWLGAAHLLTGRDPAEARELLRRAVSGMRRARRHLELPAAAIFLAEAEWCAGDEEAHDAACEVAFEAAEACGTLRPLEQALELTPGVLARRLDAERAGERRWRALVRTGDGMPAFSPAAGARLRIWTLGEPEIEIDGRPLPVLLTKAVEVAATVARAGPPGVPRTALVAELFGGSRDGSNYLRQIVYRLRRALPSDLALVSGGGRLAWRPAEAVTSDDALLEWLVARARLEVGERRTATLRDAVALAARGPYLHALDDDSAAARRRQVAGVAQEARLEYARAMRAAGSAGEALASASLVVEEDPYREDAWQEIMRTRAHLGGPAAVLPVFLACERALRDVGLEPSRETRVLLERLRG
jgi:ATP/maltotriose-dependent transcriptional regulator MalT/DNA-binding SARP family transcriptional activator